MTVVAQPAWSAPPLDLGELPHTLEFGWVSVAGREVHDPRLAALVAKLLLCDHPIYQREEHP